MDTGPDGVRELRDRLPSGRPFGTIGVVGYGRSRRLRATASTGIFTGARHSDRVCSRYAGFTGEREAEGSSLETCAAQATTSTDDMHHVVDRRGQPPLSGRPHHPGRVEEGSPR